MVSFLVGVALLVFLSSRFDVDVSETWNNVKASDPILYILAFSSYYSSFIFRGWRWRILLSNTWAAEDRYKLPPVWLSGQYIFLSWFANTISWFRLGDAYRAYLLAQRSNSSFSQSMGTVLAERALDVITVFAMLIVALLALSGGINTSSVVGFVAIGGGLTLLATVGLLTMRQVGSKLERFLPGRLRGAYGRLHQGTMDSFKNNILLVTTLGVMGWLCELGRIYLVIQALGFSADLPLILFVMLAHAIFTAIPLTPGGLGIAEPGMVGLLILGMSQDNAVSVALLDRSISYLSIVILGALLFLIRQTMSAKHKQARRSTPMNN